MVAATPTPGHGCSGRLWVTRCERDYLRGAATRRRFFTTRHVTSFQRICPRTPELGQRASHRNASLRLTLPLVRARGSEVL
jgi:hypothetical protein